MFIEGNWWRRRELNYAGPLTINNLAKNQSVKGDRIAQNLGSRYKTGTQNPAHFANRSQPVSDDRKTASDRRTGESGTARFSIALARVT